MLCNSIRIFYRFDWLPCAKTYVSFLFRNVCRNSIQGTAILLDNERKHQDKIADWPACHWVSVALAHCWREAPPGQASPDLQPNNLLNPQPGLNNIVHPNTEIFNGLNPLNGSVPDPYYFGDSRFRISNYSYGTCCLLRLMEIHVPYLVPTVSNKQKNYVSFYRFVTSCKLVVF